MAALTVSIPDPRFDRGMEPELARSVIDHAKQITARMRSLLSDTVMSETSSCVVNECRRGYVESEAAPRTEAILPGVKTPR